MVAAAASSQRRGATAPPAIITAVEELWVRQNREDWILGMASGRVAEGGAVYDLDIFGVFQKCQGSEFPEADDFFEAEPWWRDTIHLDPISPCMGGRAETISLARATVRLADWEILPCVLHGHSYVAARWQWWRMIRGLWLPLPNLAGPGGYDVECGEDGITVTANGQPLGQWRDWTAGVTETQSANLTPRTGETLILRRSAVDDFANTHGYTFCWACRVVGFQREHSFGKYDQFSICRVIGANNIVLPERT
jgi:hypothetical protein